MMASRTKVIDKLSKIMSALQVLPTGALLEQIAEQSGLELSNRTLQRHLLKLQQTGKIRIEGKARNTQYFLLNQPSQVNVDIPASYKTELCTLQLGTPEGATESILLLSTQAQQIFDLVNAPLSQRTPVGYNANFLADYQPNVIHYFTPSELEQLNRWGTTAMPAHPAGTYAKTILSRLLIDLSWNSSRLEGNTYSLLDTQRLIDFGHQADEKTTLEAQMILNHKDTIEFLVNNIDDIGFNRYTLLNLHGLLSNNLLPDPSASGRLRHMAVGISHSAFQPLAIPQQIQSAFTKILTKAGQIKDPFEQAFFIMVQLPYLQPFDDVNKRVSRLASNIPFINHNLSPLSFVDVADKLYISGLLGVYELNRIELLKEVFLWAYRRSARKYAAIRQSIGEPDPFRLKYRDNIRELISTMVTATLNQKDAAATIKRAALSLPQNDQALFIEAVETELMSLHEGNFARYQIRPSVFDQWLLKWRSAS